MEVIYFDELNFDMEGTNVIALRGTAFDKLRFDGYFRIYNEHSREEWGVASVVDCAVLRFDDITSDMYPGVKKERLLKDLKFDHFSFNEKEIVTLVFFLIHHKYKEREYEDGEADSSD